MFSKKLWEYIENIHNKNNVKKLCIRSLFSSRLVLLAGPNDRKYNIYRLLVTVEKQGCAYSDKPIDITPYVDCIDKSVLELKNSPIFIQLAVLDAIIPSLNINIKTQKFILEGVPWDKAIKRANVITKNIMILLNSLKKSDPKIALIGYVDPIFCSLIEKSVFVDVFDLDPKVIGKKLCNGAVIKDGDSLYSTKLTYDILLITGMTLANNSFQGLSEYCKNTKALVAMYAQTGGNLGPIMINLGVDLFIGENSPFYYEDGISEMNLFVNKKYQILFN